MIFIIVLELRHSIECAPNKLVGVPNNLDLLPLLLSTAELYAQNG